MSGLLKDKLETLAIWLEAVPSEHIDQANVCRAAADRIATLEAQLAEVEALPAKWLKRTGGDIDPDNYVWTKGFDAGMNESTINLTAILAKYSK